MIFIDANGRKLYAYIASVFGGVKEEIDEPEQAYKSIQYLSRACTLLFEVTSDGGLIEKITPTDLTASFFNQREYIEKIWGDCTELTRQGEINDALTNLYPELYPSGKKPAVDTAGHKFLQLSQKNQDSHKCIVTEGQYKLESNSDSSCKYTLSCLTSNHQPIIDGLEVMNWIKLEIDLKTNILNKPVQFSIVFDKSTQHAVFTPDFTWYFAPPAGHVISSESSVKVDGITDKNAIQGVSDETTVYFSEWTNPPESINERKKSRILFKSLSEIESKDLSMLSNYKKLAVSLHLDNPQGPSNRQFFFGLFIAFLLAFCSDKTRINDFYQCLHENCSCVGNTCICHTICNAVTIAAPILLLLCFLSFILPPKKALPYSGKRSTKIAIFPIIRLMGLLTTVLLMVYVYCLWLLIPDVMHSYINCSLNQMLLIYGAIASLITNTVYLIYCLGFLKRKIYNYI